MARLLSSASMSSKAAIMGVTLFSFGITLALHLVSASPNAAVGFLLVPADQAVSIPRPRFPSLLLDNNVIQASPTRRRNLAALLGLLSSGGIRLRAGRSSSCPSAKWKEFQGTCYLSVIEPEPVTFTTAYFQCSVAHEGANLATIPSKEVNDFLTGLTPNTRPRWTGAIRKHPYEGGFYEWMRIGAPRTFMNFPTKRFGFADGSQATADLFGQNGPPNAMSLEPNGKWMGRYALHPAVSSKLPGYICEFAPGAKYQFPNLKLIGRHGAVF